MGPACAFLQQAQKKLRTEVLGTIAERADFRAMREQRQKDCSQGQVLSADSQTQLDDLMKVAQAAKDQGLTPDALRGKKIVSTVCLDCHNASSGSYGFFETEAATAAYLKKHPGFAKEVAKRLHSSNLPMPPEAPLATELEKLDVMEYLNQFVK